MAPRSRRPAPATRPGRSPVRPPGCRWAAFFLGLAALAALCLLHHPAWARQTLRIGFVIGLTGPGAPDDSDIWKGALLAVEEINAGADETLPRIEMTSHDTQNQPILAKAAAKQAVAAGAQVLLAPSYSSQALEAARVAQEHGIPIISVIATHPDITAVGDFTFRVCFNDHDQALVMADFARTDLGARTAVILTDLTSAYSLAMTSAFRDRFTSLGGQVLAEIEYKMRQHDFADVAGQAAAARADVMFMPGYWLDSAALLKDLQASGLASVLLAGDGWGSTRFADLRGELPVRGYYTDHWAPFMDDEASRRFTQDYSRRFGRMPVAGAALAYDAVRVAALAASRAGTTRPDDLRRAIAGIRDFPGITGTMSFSASGETQKSVHVMELSHGRAGLFKTVAPEGKN